MRRLVLLLDGTWNTPKSDTNIHRLIELVPAAGADGTEQLVYYQEGVGTGRFDRFRGGMFGLGLSQHVREAYGWVCDHYRDGDQLFIFGFSRGAYTARSLAGLISACGLLPANPTMSLDEVWEKYRQDGRGLDGERIKVDIDFIGVFDTVGALGVPLGPIRSRFTRKGTLFHRTTPSVRYRAMYHALAIDENRPAFQASLWTRYAHEQEPPDALADGQTLEQRWFVGAHSNVGGGYEDNPLADVSLAWMVGKAREHGLETSGDVTVAPDAHLGPVVDSLKRFLLGAYWAVRLGRRHWRSIGASPRRVKVRKTGQAGRSFPINESIDASVFLRYQQDADYRPESLETWAEAAGVDLATVAGDERVGDWL